MPSRTNLTDRKPRGRSHDHLYLVFKVDRDRGEMLQLSKKAHPASGEEVFDLSTRDSRNEIIVNTSGPRRNVARHPMPCGECSAAKTKCVPVPSEPALCERCKKKNRSVCPPHIPWSHRKTQSTRSLSEGSPPSQTSSHQPSPPADQAEMTSLQAHLPVSHLTEPYSMNSGELSYGQGHGGLLFYLSASQASEFPVGPYFTGSGFEAPGATHPQMEPLFSNFHSTPTAEQTEIPPAIYQEPAHYQQDAGGYWYGPSAYHQ